MSKKENNSHFHLVGKRIFHIRKEMKLSQEQFSRKANLNKGVLHRIEHGTGGTIDNFLKIMVFLQENQYNIKWLIYQNNDSEFMTDDDLRLYTFPTGEIKSKAKEILKNSQSLIDTLKTVGF
ncbi:helix-turn-helix domain-containing protein [Spongiimicrobium sp. 3-5]|uniref:helix-turn-helix domain-containing protein n=1 Tax=Spongiimicrobium sp. 3-5 TaxID=3332596 RepID=UPI00397FEA80